VLLGRTPRDSDASESALKKAIASVVKQVALELRNTPAVCRKSYINPLVFDGWRSGVIHDVFGASQAGLPTRKAESLVLDFLRSIRTTPAERQTTTDGSAHQRPLNRNGLGTSTSPVWAPA
jgi:DNA topoisomerase IB